MTVSSADIQRAEKLIAEAKALFSRATDLHRESGANMDASMVLNEESKEMLRKAQELGSKADEMQVVAREKIEEGERLRHRGEAMMDEAAKILGLPPRRLLA